MKIATYLNPDLVFFLDTKSKDETLKTLVDTSSMAKSIADSDAFLKAIRERENIVSTGIGMGVAIPHAKLAQFRDFFLVVGILKQGVDWKALDNAPVRLVFLIGGPEDKQTEYLQILSALTSAIRDEGLRKELLQTEVPAEVIKFFEGL